MLAFLTLITSVLPVHGLHSENCTHTPNWDSHTIDLVKTILTVTLVFLIVVLVFIIIFCPRCALLVDWCWCIRTMNPLNPEMATAQIERTKKFDQIVEGSVEVDHVCHCKGNCKRTGSANGPRAVAVRPPDEGGLPNGATCETSEQSSQPKEDASHPLAQATSGSDSAC